MVYLQLNTLRVLIIKGPAQKHNGCPYRNGNTFRTDFWIMSPSWSTLSIQVFPPVAIYKPAAPPIHLQSFLLVYLSGFVLFYRSQNDCNNTLFTMQLTIIGANKLPMNHVPSNCFGGPTHLLLIYCCHDMRVTHIKKNTRAYLPTPKRMNNILLQK